MITPNECGPLPEWATNMMRGAEHKVDQKLREKYSPYKHDPVSIFNEVNDMRVCGDKRVFDEFIHRYQANGWECVWIPNNTDGMAAPYLVAKGYAPKSAQQPTEGEES